MKFDTIYLKAVELWPNDIDISDGLILEDGTLFMNLSLKWNQVEEVVKRKKMDEWVDLMTWIIFKNLKGLAVQKFLLNEKSIFLSQINIDKVKADFLENLRCEGYEDMLEEYQIHNHNSE